MHEPTNHAGPVLTCGELADGGLAAVIGRFGLTLEWCADGAPIPGSYWGEPEAGRIGTILYLRADTPVHSALHEAGHFICMDAGRRLRDSIDAGGTALEECGVCYLQIRLADELPGMGRDRMLADMDGWGYSFRLGSARAWFERDAEDARAFLQQRGVLDAAGNPPAGAEIVR